MRELALHYEILRNNYPNVKLLILFDIDGTLLDNRYTIRALLNDSLAYRVGRQRTRYQAAYQKHNKTVI